MHHPLYLFVIDSLTKMCEDSGWIMATTAPELLRLSHLFEPPATSLKLPGKRASKRKQVRR
jgi:hypothetical protein